MKLASPKQVSALTKAGYTQAELAGLTSRRASSLIYYVSRNNWKRPTQAQIDAIAAAALTEDDLALQAANFIVQIPSSSEFEELIKDMSPSDRIRMDDAMELLREAARQGHEAALDQGRALWILQICCQPKDWPRILAALQLPIVTATRQIAAAKTEAEKNSAAKKMLKSYGVDVFTKVKTPRSKAQLETGSAGISLNSEESRSISVGIDAEGVGS